MAPKPPAYIDLEQFRASRGAKSGALQKFVEGGAVAEPGVLAEVVMSTATRDRARDSVSVAGWKTANFSANPVLQWCHDYSAPPVGKVSTVVVDGGALIGRRLVFIPREIDAFAASVGAMYTHPERFLRMFSVGFQPERYAFNEQEGGIDFLEQDLLELSACPIGMNPDALAAAKSARVDVAPWSVLAAKWLDGDREAPRWMDANFAAMVHRTLAPPVHQVPAVYMAALKAEVEPFAARIAAIEAELRALKNTAPTPPVRSPDVAKALEAASAYLSNRTAG